MEKKYKTFEDFMDINTINNVLGDEYAYIDLNPSNIEDQKFIANFYETSLGHIQLIDPVKHVYSVTTEEREDIKVIIYSDDNATIIKENAYNYFMKSLEEPMKDINYSIIESVGRIDLYAYLNTETLEADFKSKFKLDVFMDQKNGYKFIRVEENYFVFEV